jgi:hypothetical protein
MSTPTKCLIFSDYFGMISSAFTREWCSELPFS